MEMMKNWIETPNFKEREFVCRCAACQRVGRAFVSRRLVVMLQMARIIAKIPFVILSGCRCVAHNNAKGGRVNSSHIGFDRNNLTQGVDIRARSDIERFIILNALLQAGFRRIGLNFAENFIHVDICPNRDQKVLWRY